MRISCGCNRLRSFARAASVVCSTVLILAMLACGEDRKGPELSIPPARPLIVLRISKDVLVSTLEQEIDETTAVEETLLGTRVAGTARTNGQPQVDLLDDPDRVSLLVTLRGTTASRTKGQTEPPVIHSRSETAFIATKRVVFVPGKGFFTEPTKVTAQTKTFTEGVETARGGIVGRIVARLAENKVENYRDQINDLARQKAEHRIAHEFDKILQQRLNRMNGTVDLRTAIVGRNVRPAWCCCSTSQGVLVALSPADRPITWTAVPQSREKAGPIQLLVHRSLVGEFERALARLDRARAVMEDFVHRRLGTTVALSDAGNGDGDPPPPTNVNCSIVQDWIVFDLGGNSAAETGVSRGPSSTARQGPTPGLPALRDHSRPSAENHGLASDR
jgi:hypothetical protein